MKLNEKNNTKTVRLKCEEGCATKATAGIKGKTSAIPLRVTQRAPMQMQGAKVSSGKALQVVSPDLTLTHFIVNQNARQQVSDVTIQNFFRVFMSLMG